MTFIKSNYACRVFRLLKDAPTTTILYLPRIQAAINVSTGDDHWFLGAPAGCVSLQAMEINQDQYPWVLFKRGDVVMNIFELYHSVGGRDPPPCVSPSFPHDQDFTWDFSHCGIHEIHLCFDLSNTLHFETAVEGPSKVNIFLSVFSSFCGQKDS